MPIYEYQCGHCQHQYEKKEGFDAPVEQACPVCGELARRLLHAPGIVFKGPGFYVTDNRKNHEWESAEKEAKAEKSRVWLLLMGSRSSKRRPGPDGASGEGGIRTPTPRGT